MVLVCSGNIFSACHSVMAAGMIPVVQIFEQRFRMIRKTEYFFHDGEKVLHNDGFNVWNGGCIFLYGKDFVFDRIFFGYSAAFRIWYGKYFVFERNGCVI